MGLDGCLGRRLCGRVVRREHPQTTAEQKIGTLVEGGAEARILEQLSADLFDEVAGGLPFGRHAPLGRQRCIDVAVVLLVGDIAGLEQAEQGKGAALVGDVGEPGRVVAVGVGDQPGEQRPLGPGQPIGRYAEVDLGSSPNAVGTRTEVHRVEVGLEDLVFGQLVLQPDREGSLGDLAFELLLARQDAVLDQLLGDGRATLLDATGIDVLDKRSTDRLCVDAVVVVEALVLHDEQRHDHCVTDVVERDELAVFDVVQDVELIAVHVVHDRAEREFVEVDLGAGRLVGRKDVAESRCDCSKGERHRQPAATDDGGQSQQPHHEPSHWCQRYPQWMGRPPQPPRRHMLQRGTMRS